MLLCVGTKVLGTVPIRLLLSLSLSWSLCPCLTRAAKAYGKGRYINTHTVTELYVRVLWLCKGAKLGPQQFHP